MRFLSGKGLVTFVPTPPIDVTPIRKFASHFDQIYAELESKAPDVCLMQTVQEALLALYCHRNRAFIHKHDTLQDIDVSIFHVCLKALEEDPYGYQRVARGEDGKKFNEFVSVYTHVLQAFASIYSLSQCTPSTLRKKLLLSRKPDPNGTHFMVALCRMQLAIGLREQPSQPKAPT